MARLLPHLAGVPRLDFCCVKWLLGCILLLVSCSGAAQPSPVPTEDPRVAELNAQLASARALSHDLIAQLRTTTDQLAIERCCGTFLMWETAMTITPPNYLVGGVPDTFTLHVKLTATAPIRIRIMDIDQYVRLARGEIPVALSWGPATSFDFDFHDAEGCASYVYVIDAVRPTIVTPEFTITRHVTDPTGVCR